MGVYRPMTDCLPSCSVAGCPCRAGNFTGEDQNLGSPHGGQITCVRSTHTSFPIFARVPYLWLAIAGLMCVWAAFCDVHGGIWGASRHALTVGFAATMIFAIGITTCHFSAFRRNRSAASDLSKNTASGLPWTRPSGLHPFLYPPSLKISHNLGCADRKGQAEGR
jgi:hypothetical protein